MSWPNLRQTKFYWNGLEEPREEVTVTGMLRTVRLLATRPKRYRLILISSTLKFGPTGYPETFLTKH
jgi:hypothetical protein